MHQLREVITFLRGKIGHVGPADLAYSQYEAFLLWVVGDIPGVPGFVIRTIACKVLFKRLRGFAWIQPRVTFVQTDRIEVGAHFGVNSGSYINGIGGIAMGDHVLIGSNVTISSGQHSIDGREPPVFARAAIPRAITIGDDVWIGAGAVIMPGVTLRKGTVVGANAVVTKDTDEYAVVVGAPARKIRTREP